MPSELTMAEVKECLKLLAYAAERITVNTYVEQGATAADTVFVTLGKIEKILGLEQESKR